MTPVIDRCRQISSLFQTAIFWVVLRNYHPMVNTPSLCQSLTCSIELAGLSLGLMALLASLVYHFSTLIFLVLFRKSNELKEDQQAEDDDVDQAEDDDVDQAEDDDDQAEEEDDQEEEDDSSFSIDDDHSEQEIEMKNALYTELRNRKLIPKEE